MLSTVSAKHFPVPNLNEINETEGPNNDLLEKHMVKNRSQKGLAEKREQRDIG